MRRLGPMSNLDVARLAIERLNRRERAILTEQNEAADILAEALGYVHDPEYGWATGDHTIVTLAMEVRRRGVGLDDEGERAR